MNLAVPAIVVFFVLLPGFIFRSRLKLVEKESQDFSPFGQVVAGGVIYAIILHAAVLAASYYVLDRSARLDLFVHLLISPSTLDEQEFKFIAGSAWDIAEYFGALFALALTVPSIVRATIVKHELDRFDSCLSKLCRFHRAPWYYLLSKADFKASERDNLLISVSAIVEVAGQAYLYTGLLDEYFVDKDGQLDRIVLTTAERRKFERDKAGRQDVAAADDTESNEAIDVDAGRFYQIMGDYFVIRYSEVLTLNIHYYRLDVASQGGSSEAGS